MDKCSLGSNPQRSVCSQSLSYLTSFPFLVLSMPRGNCVPELGQVRVAVSVGGGEPYRTAVTEFSALCCGLLDYELQP